MSTLYLESNFLVCHPWFCFWTRMSILTYLFGTFNTNRNVFKVYCLPLVKFSQFCSLPGRQATGKNTVKQIFSDCFRSRRLALVLTLWYLEWLGMFVAEYGWDFSAPRVIFYLYFHGSVPPDVRHRKDVSFWRRGKFAGEGFARNTDSAKNHHEYH